MTAERRLAKLEEGLSPTQLVLRWLAEARAFSDIESYVGSLLAAEPPVVPLDRLVREAAHGARTAMRGKRAQLVDAEIGRVLRETVFRFELVMRINVTAHELLDKEQLLEALFAAQLALLMCHEPKPRLADESYLKRLRLCRTLTLIRVDELLAARDACSSVEARYLDGHPALFPAVAVAFDEQLLHSQELAVTAMHLAELDGLEPLEPAGPEALSRRTDELVADLVEPARSTALEKLGEGRPAFDIANAWLREKFSRAPALVPDVESL